MTPADDLSDSDSSGPDEQQKLPQPESHQPSVNGNFQPGMVMPCTANIVPHSPFEAGHIMAPMAYPYIDPYYGGIIAAYSGSPVMHPHLMGIIQPGLPLPTDTVEEPVYVNAKQYHGILRRRQSRAKAESENKFIKCRKPYIHESRHLHATKRARGTGGRFLNSKAKGEEENEASSNKDNAQPYSTNSPFS